MEQWKAMNKRIIKGCISTFVCALLACLSFVPVHAAETPTVIYQGEEHRFVIESAVSYADNELVDLFPEFKDVMPGDTLTQSVNVKVENMQGKSVKILLSALKENEDYQTLLGDDYVTLRVIQGNRDYTGTLGDGVELGTFTDGADELITVELSIGAEATGEEIENLRAEINWLFEAQELSEETGIEDNKEAGNSWIGSSWIGSKIMAAVQTGDNTNLILWIGIIAGSGLLVLVLFLRKKKKKQ